MEEKRPSIIKRVFRKLRFQGPTKSKANLLGEETRKPEGHLWEGPVS